MGEILLRNPWCRAFIPFLLMAVSAVLGSALVVEISSGSQIVWSKIVTLPIFYLLVITTIIHGFYQVQVFRHDKEFAKGFTPKQYEARIRNRVAEQIAKRSNKLIQEGKIEQLESETEAFNRMYGEEQE